MPEANSAPIPSNPASRHPRIVPPEPGQKPKLLDRLREALRSRHYSRRTEQSYCHIRTVQELLGHKDVSITNKIVSGVERSGIPDTILFARRKSK